MAKTVFFYLDGIGYKFLKHMPYLNEIAKRGCELSVEVEPLHQMEFSIFSGKKQKEIDYWTWYYFNPKKSPYSWTKILPQSLDKRPIKKIINYLTVLKEYLKGNTHIIPIGDIPLKMLKYFDLTSKKSFIDKNPIEIPTLFDKLRKNKINYYAYEWPLYSTEKKTGLKIIKKKDEYFINQILENKEKDFLFTHLTVFDGLLHKKGSKDKEIITYLKKLDKEIENACKILSKNSKDLNIFIASDHGMIDVKENIDVSKTFKGLNLIYFPDSTCIRAWGEKKEIDELKKRLKKFPGNIYTKENHKKCPITFKREFSGDLLFIAKEGYQIFPNFFDKEGKTKAMHGYDKNKELDSFFISNKKITSKKRINNFEICSLILKKILKNSI